jgi:hypothetical protein
LKNWAKNLIEGIIFLLLGLIVTAYNFLINEPIDFFLNANKIDAGLNPTFAIMLAVGFFFIGSGTAQAAVSITIYKLEKSKVFQDNQK